MHTICIVALSSLHPCHSRQRSFKICPQRADGGKGDTHSGVSAQHASPCKSMKDDVSPASQLFDMQTAFLCKFASAALDTRNRRAAPRPRYESEVSTWWQTVDLSRAVTCGARSSAHFHSPQCWDHVSKRRNQGAWQTQRTYSYYERMCKHYTAQQNVFIKGSTPNSIQCCVSLSACV